MTTRTTKKKPAARKRAARSTTAPPMPERTVPDVMRKRLKERLAKEREAVGNYDVSYHTLITGLLARTIVSLGLPELPMDWTEDQRKRAFLHMLREHGNDSAAGDQIGVSKRLIKSWRKDDPEFKAEYDEAHDVANNMIELEAWRRAMLGVEEVEIQVDDGPDGRRVRRKTSHKYSDALLTKMLEGRKRKRYGTQRQQVSTPKGAPLEINTNTSESREDIMASLLALVRPKSDDPGDEVTKTRRKKK